MKKESGLWVIEYELGNGGWKYTREVYNDAQLAMTWAQRLFFSSLDVEWRRDGYGWYYEGKPTFAANIPEDIKVYVYQCEAITE